MYPLPSELTVSVQTPPTPIPTPPPESLPTSHQQTHPWNAYNSYNGTSPSLTHLQPVIPPTPPPSPPRPSPEWIYRRPKSPHSHSRSRSITPTSSPPARPRPQTGYSHPHPRLHSHSHVPSHSHHHRHHHHNHQQNTFWSAVLRPRSRSERSLPMLKAKAAELPTLPPKAMHIRAPSIASTISTSSTSSRPQTPTSPQKHQPHHRSSKYTSPNPSKSILARTASISTKNSASTTGTGNKSVKFVDMPTIHYASAGYWDIDSIYLDGVGSDSMDTGMEMDMDVDMRDVLCSTPTPEKEKAKGLKRLISLTRKPSQTAPASHRTISGPFVLGTVSTPPPTLAPIPSLPSLSDTSPYFKSTSKSKGASISGPFPLRTASSLESFRSTKSSGGRSVRSLGSVRSNKNTGIFRAWLGRMGMGVGCSVS